MTLRELTGYSPQEIVGERVENILRGPETESYSIYRIHRAIERGGGLKGVPITHYHKEGHPLSMNLTLEQVPLAGGEFQLPNQYIIRETLIEENSWFDSAVLRKLKRAVSGESGSMDYVDPTETQFLLSKEE